MTEQQRRAFKALSRMTLVAECTGGSRALIVRLGERLYYLSPGGLLTRCRG